MAELERAVAAKDGPGTTTQPGSMPSHHPRAAVVTKENAVSPQPVNKAKTHERTVAAKESVAPPPANEAKNQERTVAAKQGHGVAAPPGNKAKNHERTVAANQGNGVAPPPVRSPNNQQRLVAAQKGHGVGPQPVRTPNNQQRHVAAQKGHGAAPQQGNRHNHHESNNRRKRKQKRKCLLFWLVAIVSCIAFAGSGVLIAIGYLNPGSIGLGLLGAGAVLYFGTIAFLACCCVCLTKRYPARQLQSTISRIRRRPAGNGIAVVNPQAGGRAQVRPPNPPNGHIGPVRPNHQKGQQPQDPTPKPSHSGVPSTLAVTSTSSDEWSSTDHSPVPQRKDINAKTLQLTDFNITSDEDPPVDVRIVSHPKKEQRPREKTTTDSSCEDSETEPSSDPPVDVRIVSRPKKEQTSQEKITTDVRPEGSNAVKSADPLTEVRIVSNSKKDLSQQEKTSISTGFENSITASNIDQTWEYNLVSIPKKDQRLQDKTDTALGTATTTNSHSANAPSDGLIISHPNQDKQQEKKADMPSSSENITSAADPPIDVRIVPNPRKPRARQNGPTIEEFGNVSMPITTDRRGSKEAIPDAHGSRDFASTSSSDPPTDGPSVSQHKAYQQHNKTSHTASDSEDFMALGYDPTSHQRKEKHKANNPSATQSEDPTASLSIDPLTNLSPVPKRRKAQRTREITDISTCSRDFVWVPADMIPDNLKVFPHPKQDQQQRGKMTSTSDAEGVAAQAIAPLINVAVHHKQGSHHLDTDPKDPRSADVSGSTTEAVHQLRHAADLRSHPHSQHPVHKVSSSGGCGSSAGVDTSSTERPNSLPTDNAHHHPPSSPHPKDRTTTAGDPPEGKLQQPEEQEKQSQGSIPPAGRTEAASHGDASSDRKDALS